MFCVLVNNIFTILIAHVCNQLVNKQIYNETRITSKSCNNYSNLMTKCMAMVECTNISCKQQTFKFQYY